MAGVKQGQNLCPCATVLSLKVRLLGAPWPRAARWLPVLLGQTLTYVDKQLHQLIHLLHDGNTLCE